MEQLKSNNYIEEINLGNINKIYFDLKQAQIMAGVSNQTLYTYAADSSNDVTMIKFKGKNYMHIQDIHFIKREVEVNRTIRNSAAIAIEDELITDETEKLEKEVDRLNKINEDLKNKLYEEQQSKLNLMSEISNLRQELGELREFKKNADNLNELIKVLSSEKDELYKKQINSLVDANTDLMDKFDKLIDSQNAFQVMLAQKEQTSQKLIEEKKTNKGFFSRLLNK